MTDKERLGEIERSWERKSDDYNWLIEKARLTEEYSEIIVSQNESLTELMEQNKRYREALKFYAEEKHVAHCLYGDKNNDLVNDYGEVARKALEESK